MCDLLALGGALGDSDEDELVAEGVCPAPKLAPGALWTFFFFGGGSDIVTMKQIQISQQGKVLTRPLQQYCVSRKNSTRPLDVTFQYNHGPQVLVRRLYPTRTSLLRGRPLQSLGIYYSYPHRNRLSTGCGSPHHDFGQP